MGPILNLLVLVAIYFLVTSGMLSEGLRSFFDSPIWTIAEIILKVLIVIAIIVLIYKIILKIASWVHGE